MERKITVKGIGHITAKPDLCIIYMTIDETNRKYEQAVDDASDKINELSNALVRIGIEKDALKTADFKVDVETGFKKNFKGVGEIVKTGFTCTYRMKLAFDFSSERLSKVIDAITTCISDPRLSIAFTVKDEEAVKDELLKSAGANARRRAQILCEAAGGNLGNLVTVNYNWNEISILSPTRFTSDGLSNTGPLCCDMPTLAPGSIEPDDIDLVDNAVFVWEII